MCFELKALTMVKGHVWFFYILSRVLIALRLFLVCRIVIRNRMQSCYAIYSFSHVVEAIKYLYSVIESHQIVTILFNGSAIFEWTR